MNQNGQKPPAQPTERWVIWARIAFIAVPVSLIIFGYIDSTFIHPPTPEQIRAEQARQARENEIAAQRHQHREYLESMCWQQKVCKEYAHVRQECATAGNFDTCVGVKMGDEDGNTVDQCTHDGKLAYPPPDMLDGLECWEVNLQHKSGNP